MPPLGIWLPLLKKITPPLSPFAFCSCYIDELVQEQNKSLTIKKRRKWELMDF
jgi:hypothetical protein